MEKLNAFGRPRTLALGLMLAIAAALAGADDKKKPENVQPQQQRPANQVSRPTPPPRSTTTYHPQKTGTNVYHPPATGNATGTSTGNKGAVNTNPRSTVSPAYRPSPTPTKAPSGVTTYKPNSVTTYKPNNTYNSPVNHGPVVNKQGPTSVHTYQPVRTTRSFGGRQVSYDRVGHVRDIHSRDIDVHRSVRGTRTFVAESHGQRIVGLGPNRGYLEHSYLHRNGRVYVQRTYVVGRVTYARVYRSYYWHGAVYYHYVPAIYYRPAFYGWVYNPWPVRVVWGWGWGAAPWFGFYGYYFAPYPVYPAASFWLTDYLLAQNLQLAYAAQQNAEGGYPGPDAGAAPPNQVQLTPEIKQMIADEVQRQLAAEQGTAGATGSQSNTAPPPAEETPAALDPNSRVFVVSSTLDVVKDDGSECTLTAGDVILRTGSAPDGTKIAVNVITSKRDDCPSNTNTAVEVSDLQEMQNQFREQIDSGLKVLADSQGKDGLPNAPDTSTIAGEVPPPAPDAGAEADLEDQQKNADHAEAEVQKASGGAPQN